MNYLYSNITVLFYFVFIRPFEVLDASFETPEGNFWFEGDLPVDSAKENKFEPPFDRTEARGFADWLTAERLRWIF
jgi:hypothetical protein